MSKKMSTVPVEEGNRSVWVLAAAVLTAAVLGLGVGTGWFPGEETIEYRDHEPVSFEEVETIVAQRCEPCHAEQPSSDLVDSPPAGVTFETRREIESLAERIMVRTVEKREMPLDNRTGMTVSERETLGAWIHQRAEAENAQPKRAAVTGAASE